MRVELYHTLHFRCVLIQFVAELWEHTTSREGLCVARFSDREPVSGSFNIILHSYGRKVPMKEKIELIENMQYLPLTLVGVLC